MAAYTQIEIDRTKVFSYLEKANVKKDMFWLSSISTYPTFKINKNGDPTNIIEGYNLTKTVTIRLSDIGLIDKLSRESTDLIKDNVNFNSQLPEYYFTKIDQLKIELFGEASRDSKARAEKLAQSSNNKVGALRSAQQGVFQITPEHSTSVSDYGENDTTSIRKSVKAVVSIQYAVE